MFFVTEYGKWNCIAESYQNLLHISIFLFFSIILLSAHILLYSNRICRHIAWEIYTEQNEKKKNLVDYRKKLNILHCICYYIHANLNANNRVTA